MQTSKYQPEGKQIMLEKRLIPINPIALRKAKIVYNFAFLSAIGLNLFPALSIDPSIGMFWFAWRPMIDYFSYLLL